MRLENLVVLISGGAKGMGASHARAMAAQGAKIVLGDILEAQTQALAEELGQANALAVRLDVTATADWDSAVAATVQRFGRLDVLVNNAGILLTSPIEECSDADWRRVIEINLDGTFKGIRAAARAMRAAGGGSIINISSTAGLKGFAGASAYVASKFAIRGLTKAAALELAAHGIRVNSVHPGNIDTDMIAGIHGSLKHVAMDRLGRSEEISNLIVFLASPESSFSTGSEFVADGGETSGIPELY